MANLIDIMASRTSLNKPASVYKHTFTFDTEGKVKPLEDKAVLLPSRIFGSPVEYVKDLKKDIINVGRAAKGQGNDHELGRINDLAMKLGSLGLAAYLFIKNPLKLSKTMEFVGFGTFFGAMALWPKLTIQAPLKARTGVDIHQRYIDSQGRKKMLHQDPQYDLTDLYSREDLDKMGKKLKVNENLPDRDRFIKQRAKKVAVQGNTLWMLTAGFASPIISALACNSLEKPINKAFEVTALKTSDLALNDPNIKNAFNKLKRLIKNNKSFEKFITENAGKEVTDEMIGKIAHELSSGVNSNDFNKSLTSYLTKLINSVKSSTTIDEEFVKRALQGKIPDNIISTLTESQKNALETAMQEGSITNIGKLLANITGKNQGEKTRLAKEFTSKLKKEIDMQPVALSQISDKVTALNSSLKELASGRKLLDKYINARVGDKSGTYIANQWERVCNTLFKSLKLSNKDLVSLKNGDMEVLTRKLTKLSESGNKKAYDKLMNKLLKLIGDYEQKAGTDFISRVADESKNICGKAASELSSKGFTELAEVVKNPDVTGTLENTINTITRDRALGAKSSFYRLLQTLNIMNPANRQVMESRIRKEFKKLNKKQADKNTINKIFDTCQQILMEATPTDYVEKLKSAKFKLDQNEYKIVMNVLFGSKGEIVKDTSGSAKVAVDGFKEYSKEFIDKVANWRNPITPDLTRTVVNGQTGANAVERSNLVGKPIKDLIKETAGKTYNSRKWLMIFGITMGVLTAVTLTAGLFIGRKGKIEKQLEESKQNG